MFLRYDACITTQKTLVRIRPRRGLFHLWRLARSEGTTQSYCSLWLRGNLQFLPICIDHFLLLSIGFAQYLTNYLCLISRRLREKVGEITALFLIFLFEIRQITS